MKRTLATILGLAAVLAVAGVRAADIPQIDGETRSKLSRSFIAKDGGTSTGLTNTGGFFLGGTGVIGTNGSDSTLTVNMATTFNGSLTAPNASSTAASALANVAALDGRYVLAVQQFAASDNWRSFNGNGAGQAIPAVSSVYNLCDPWGRDGSVRVWTKAGSWTDMLMPIPSTWPVSGSVVIRSAWLPLLNDVCHSNIVVSHGWTAMSTNSTLIRNAASYVNVRSATNLVLAGPGVTNVGWWVVSTNSLPGAAYYQQARTIAVARQNGNASDTYPTNLYFLYAEVELIR